MYIPKADRELFKAMQLGEITPGSAKELSYLILVLCFAYLKKKPDSINAMLGAIESAKSELTRLKVNPKNMQEQFDHGDIK